jgi:D-3-phosphoglycerate dehydrogenase
MKVAINTSTFAELSSAPLELLKKKNIEFTLNPHRRTLNKEEVIERARGVDGIIAGVEPLTKDVLKQLNSIKVISRCGVGMDNVDLRTAKERRIAVYSTPSAPTLAVAELTVGVILSLLRQIPQMDKDVKSGNFKKQMGFLLKGKKVGIIGFGRIGSKVAELLAPFNAELAYFDTAGIKSRLAKKMDDVKDLLSWADIITLHLSADSAGKPCIGEKEMGLIRRGSWLINLSRGGFINENALYKALKSHHLAGAALDVFSEEPYKGPLCECDNALLTPHIGSYAREARVEMEVEAVQNLLKGLKIK